MAAQMPSSESAEAPHDPETQQILISRQPDQKIFGRSHLQSRQQRLPPTIARDSTVQIVLLSTFCLSLVAVGNDLIFPLWMFMNVDDGGLGLKVRIPLFNSLPSKN